MTQTTMSKEQIIEELKVKASDYIEAGETYRDNIYYNMRDHANNDYMDELMELVDFDSTEWEELKEEVINEAMDYVDELLEEQEIKEIEDVA